MFCSNCGNQVDDAKKFCPNCGKPLHKTEAPPQDTAPTQPIAKQGTQGTTAPPPFDPAYAAVAGAAAPVARSHKWVLVTVAVVVGVLVVTGLMVGLVLLFASGGSGSKAEILKVEVQDENGDEVDVDEVPVGEELMLFVEYRAEFPEDGEGILQLKAVDSRDKNLVKKKVTLESSKDAQDYDYNFEVPEESSGLKAKVEVSIDVEADDKKLDDDEKITVKMEGEPVKETTTAPSADLAAARQAAADRIQAANNAVAELAGLGISTQGLIELLEKANFLLANGTTPEELIGLNDSAAFYAEYVINECNTRKGAVAQEQARQQKPRPDEREWALCPTCGGEGLVYWEEPEYYWETCGVCYGEGGWYMDDGTWFTCEACGGEGGYYVEIMANVSDICPTCGGSGWVLSMVDGHIVLTKYCPEENRLHICPVF
ncbi:MAG: zinc-ribbon domain-containing protein [Actinobacteria bacterium]|nr:zinc-ribbon domain-containing protein [Actinomycetota bacterium]